MGAAWKHGDFLHLGDTHLLWLPLSHAFGKCLLAICFEIGICQAVEPRIPRLSRSLKEVKPFVLCGVPRIFEKIRSGVMTQFQQGLADLRAAGQPALLEGLATSYAGRFQLARVDVDAAADPPRHPGLAGDGDGVLGDPVVGAVVAPQPVLDLPAPPGGPRRRRLRHG